MAETTIDQNLANPTNVLASEYENFAQLVAQLGAIEFKEFGIDSFTNRNRKHVKLVGNIDPDLHFSAKDEWFGFEFDELKFVDTVVVTIDGDLDDDDFKMSFVDPFSEKEIVKAFPTQDGTVSFPISSFMRGFGIKPPWKLWKKVKIKRISVTGSSPSELSALLSSFNKVANVRDKLAADANRYVTLADKSATKLQTNLAAIEEQETELEKIGDETEIAIAARDAAEKERLTKFDEVTKVEQRLKETQVKVIEIDDQLEKKLVERKRLNSDVSDSIAKLSKLKGDIHLFPSEISGYVKQGSRNIWLYIVLSIIPFVILGAVTYKLFSNSELLLNVLMTKDRPPIGEYLLSRAPYALVSAIILTICYTMLHRLFSEIVAINRRKQELQKISIVATDVSFASFSDLGLSDEETYHLRTQSKMELLKQHLKQHLPEDYVYGGTTGPIHALLEFARKKLDKKSSSEPLETSGDIKEE